MVTDDGQAPVLYADYVVQVAFTNGAFRLSFAVDKPVAGQELPLRQVVQYLIMTPQGMDSLRNALRLTEQIQVNEEGPKA